MEVGGVGDYTSWKANRALSDTTVSFEEAQAEVRSKGLHARDMVLRSLYEYLSLSIDDALASPDALIRSVAILDKRTGKRRLRSLRGTPMTNALERRCLEFRCEVEGIR